MYVKTEIKTLDDCLVWATLYDGQEEWQFIWLSEGSLKNESGMIKNDPASGLTYIHLLD